MPTLLNQSPALLAALLLLIAYGLPGVALLRRFAPETLDRAEIWIYGVPLGVVISSLILLGVSSLAGFSLFLVLAVAAAVVAVSVRPLLTEFRELRSPESKRPAWGRFALFVLAAFGIRWAIFWARGYRFDESGLQASNTGFWADWALHMGDVSSFLYGNNFPPVHPRFIGAPHSYHYLTSVTAAAMASLGGSIPFVLLLQSLVLSLFVLLAVFCFARRISGDSRVAALTLVLLFLGGTLGWLLFIRQADSAHAFWSTLWRNPWNGADQEAAANFRWQNVFFALLQPQRSFLYGIPLGMLVLSLLEAGTRVRERRLFLLAGAVAGLLPFANLSTLLALALITPVLFLIFPLKQWFFFFAA